ncbi:MAG: hypothetical protein KUA43_10085 [Hoeflea sp.]|uniref:hypothetical protein n=1 Tax=Hoeflea sp. TaxID=1940281 RepID=UPI001D415B5F|nr:hypothetical protein [Hoeflea sp.]MBU4529451.1 hypothetical protein [Alphaproteobacteria bacterium]MBU4546570.1 hypothetical protein [Alphaproteobacteria bacterium]MBU4550838.1 hypothetical protein [Alphaproteobacteria bacterium]MBV1723780.1 hypothetical protein [Hoeflea sp.]MBV1763057.1 hypothetical protein [Hoeflea sp.]
MQPKRYELTQLGGAKENRRVYPRRDANCPVIAHVRRRHADEHVAVPCWLVNLSEDGCLVTSDYFPSKVEDLYIIIPGLGSKVHGKARSQGNYTLNVKFTTLLTPDIVGKIGRITVIPKS